MAATRRTLLIGAASAVLLTACGGGGGVAGVQDGDMSLGDANAKVHLIEYASATCPVCAAFHANVWETLKSEYIDTGKVRFTFREFPVHGPEFAVAGFQFARCGEATPEQYFNRIGALFDQQARVFDLGSMSATEAALQRLGQAAGLSPEQVSQCLRDESGTTRTQRVLDDGTANGVTGTPTFFLNGEKVNQNLMTPEGMKQMLDAALAAS